MLRKETDVLIVGGWLKTRKCNIKVSMFMNLYDRGKNCYWKDGESLRKG